MDSISSSESTDQPMGQTMPKRLKPNPVNPVHDLTVVHCPRCDSTHTKFCYYNNYSLSQPRYFCKSCRRYWTKGGTLRNIPIGGVSRKTKKLYNKQRRRPEYNLDGNPVTRSSIWRQFSYPESSVQSDKLANVSEFSAYQNLTFDFMESNGGGGSNREYEYGDHFPATVSNGYEVGTGNTHGLITPFGEMMSYYNEMINVDDVKPKLFDFDFDWRDQTGCHSDLHDLGIGRNGSSMYLLGNGSSWTGLMNGYGSTSTNSLV